MICADWATYMCYTTFTDAADMALILHTGALWRSEYEHTQILINVFNIILVQVSLF